MPSPKLDKTDSSCHNVAFTYYFA